MTFLNKTLIDVINAVRIKLMLGLTVQQQGNADLESLTPLSYSQGYVVGNWGVLWVRLLNTRFSFETILQRELMSLLFTVY